MSRVFIPNLPTRYDAATNARVPSLDLNPAAKFGELVNMTVDDHDQIEAIRTESRNITEEDFILCVGDVVLTAAAIHFAIMENGFAKVLRWDRVRHVYKVEEITL